MRWLVARLWHEGNSFSPRLTTAADFARAEWWRGDEVPAAARGVDSELGAAVAWAGELPAGSVAFSRCAAAAPAGPLAPGLFGRIRDEIAEDIRRERPDAIYLSLHGALLAADEPAPDLALLATVREAAGEGAVIGVSLDLHANLHPGMTVLAPIFAAYRSYPHVDMHDTAARVLRLIADTLDGRCRPRSALAPLNRLLPSHAMRTAPDEPGPMAEVMASLQAWEHNQPGLLALSALGGFAYGDVPHAGAAGLACVDERRLSPEPWAARVRDALAARAPRFYPRLPTPAEGLAEARRLIAQRGRGARRPVAVLDPADNPLSGGAGDTTALLQALLAEPLPGPTVFAFFHDRSLVHHASAAGVGAELQVHLGGRLLPSLGPPVPLRVCVLRVTDGCFVNAGPMWAGQARDLGPSVVLQDTARPQLSLIVTSSCESPNDPAWFALHGVDLASLALLCVKAKNHFRAAFASSFEAMIDVDAPGPACLDLTALPFRQVPIDHRRPAL
ncbi:MAG: M81 family metallopeptidase [Burkholderiaceae bacterium]